MSRQQEGEKGRAIAQAARVRAQGRSCGICDGKSGTGAAFSEYLGFPCQFSFHRLLHIHHLSSGASTIGRLMADVPSRLSVIPPQEIKTHGGAMKLVSSVHNSTLKMVATRLSKMFLTIYQSALLHIPQE
jgi:hypothetical protein